MSSVQFFSERAREHLTREIIWVIANRLRDPRIPPVVTITGIKLAPDMRNATVRFSIFGDEKEQKSALIALNRAAPFIQRAVGEKLTYRHLPRLLFKLDHSFEQSQRINELLDTVKDDLV